MGLSESALYMKSADGTGEDEVLVAEGLQTTSPNDWSPDGRFLLYVIGHARWQTSDILALPVEGDQKMYFSLRPRSTRRTRSSLLTGDG